ncbi:TorF family putative porin [Pseudomonas sp. No.117]
MTLCNHRAPAAALLCLAILGTTAQADDDLASYALTITPRLLSDVRNRSISDSLNQPGAKVTVEFAHESGLIGLAEFGTVNKKQFIDGDGANVLLAGGYRFGDPEAWHFGVGLAGEFFPGAHFKAPSRIDPDTGAPDGYRSTNYNSQFAVLEIGYGALQGRILNVLSENYRGANTPGVCGAQLQFNPDPTKGLECYAKGDHDSRGSLLYDLDYRYELTPRTSLKLHAGYQQIRNFSEANFSDYGVGLVHKRWGFDFGLDYVSPHTRARELYIAEDGDHQRTTDEARWVLSVARPF